MASRNEFTPITMTPEVGSSLRQEGYNLPESWPFPARVVPNMSSRAGWAVQQIGSYEDKGNTTVYIAPDGTRFCRASNGSRVAVVAVSKRTSPALLRVLPGTRRPKWVIEDTPKGEIPDHLRKFLLQKGEKLAKGQQRKAREVAEQAQAFAVEPVSYGNGKKISEAELRAFVQREVQGNPKIGLTILTLTLRASGRSCSGGRVREMLKQVRGGK